MKKLYLAPVLVAVATLIGACSSVPTSTGLLEQARSDYRVAQSNPNTQTYAPLEMKQASEAMALANVEANDRASAAKVDQLAYLARQKIALTQEVTKQKMAEAEVTNAGKQRDQLRLDQRTNEANAANISADRAKQEALIAQSKTAQAQRETQIAQVDAANAQRQAQEAQTRSAALEAVLNDLAAKKTARGMVITLGDVLFGTDLSSLTPDGMSKAQKLANVLRQYPQLTVLVEGFADSTGAAAYNQALSERRAAAVQSALQQFGVARDRVAVRGYGESYPVATNDSAGNRQLNRRVEIVLSDEHGKVMSR
jgi:outer membrane protein OmpA-like peptidoglycan-associated protein